MAQEEIKQYVKDNLKLSWEHKNGNYFIVLKLDGEKVTELNFGERGYKDCNGCEYNRTVKDQIGWQFRGCFGGEYKGKPIAEIELCPLKVATLPEQPQKMNALTWKDIIDIEQILNQVRYEHNCGIGEESFGKEVLERFLEQRDELLEHSEDDVRNEDAQDKVEEKPRYCVPRYWDGQYDQSELFKEQPVEGRLEMAARHVWESWNGGTMDDVRRDMKALGNVLNSRKEE